MITVAAPVIIYLMIGIVIVFADAFTGHWTIVKTLNP
jgi:hypothetical protein